MADQQSIQTLTSSSNLNIEIRHQGPDGPIITNPSLTSHRQSWWKTTTVYQIWPASFFNAAHPSTGLGDIPGITAKLPYLQSLGVETLWLSPMYDGPQQDMGYDISDYNAIYPPYGTMADMEHLITQIHARGMRIILDLVVNHTSDQHAWFKSSARSRTGHYADWYIWRDGKKVHDPQTNTTTLHPPNNWASVFGGPAWKYVPARDQFYLHIFADGQPDLNWENPELRAAVHESALRFWFEKGIDGFRVDTCNIYSKRQDLLLKDGPVTERTRPLGSCEEGIVNGPRMHEFWQEMRREVLGNYVDGGDPLMVGELGGSSVEETLRYIGEGTARDAKHKRAAELSMVFDFSYGDLGREDQVPHLTHPYPLPSAKHALGTRTQSYLTSIPPAWTSIFKENHDRPRSVSRHGTTNPKYVTKAAKLLAMMTGTLSGTLFLYQGEEIGMTNINPDTWSPSDLKDIASLNYLEDMKRRYPDDPVMWEKAWRGVCAVGRDNARTPVQWSADDENAGFIKKGSKTWMKVNENYRDGVNVKDQEGVEGSVLEFWRKVLRLRNGEEGVFKLGGYECLDEENEKTWTFVKSENEKKKHGKKAWVVLNFTEEEVGVGKVPGWAEEVVLTNCEGEMKGVVLGSWEGRVYMSK